MKFTAALISAVGLAVALSGCGDDGPRVVAGEVVEHSYDDPDQVMHCVPTGVPGKAGYNPCGVPIWTTDPASWQLKLACDDVESWVHVDAYTFDVTATGDMYPPRATACEIEE